MTDRHRELRERLGELVLGALSPTDEVALRAHLDGCADCRAELAELLPLAEDLRLVDATRLTSPPTPPADLGDRIQAAVRAETALRDRRERAEASRRRLRRFAVPVTSAAAAVLATVVVLGATDGADAPRVPMEQLVVQSRSAQVTVSSAVLVPHTWGLEVRLTATGLAQGQPFTAVAHAKDGRDLPAGAFLGTGPTAIRCNLQAALLRGDADSFSVVDASGADVLEVVL